MRICEPAGDGYICQEPSLVREAVGLGRHPEWPVGPETDWLGLRSMAPVMGAPVRDLKPELLLFGCTADVHDRPVL